MRWTKRFTKIVLRTADNAKEIVRHPLRVRWVVVDKEAFEVLLDDLHSLTSRLHEIFGDYRDRQLHEVTAETYREMIILRNNLDELKAMFEAATDLIRHSREIDANRAGPHPEHDKVLRDILRLKRIKCLSNQLLMSIENDAEADIDQILEDEIGVHRYDGNLLRRSFTSHSSQETEVLARQDRSHGVLKVGSKEHEVWIEWRSVERLLRETMEDKESRVRTVVLVGMLSCAKP